MPTDQVDLIPASELIERYDFSRDTFQDWIRSGELVGIKLGRRWFIHPDDWAAFLERRRQRGATGEGE